MERVGRKAAHAREQDKQQVSEPPLSPRLS